jgi:hypothetical protein
MLKIILIVSFLIIASMSDCLAQRRAERTSSGKAAYGIATVSGNGRIKNVKKVRKKKAVKRKTRVKKGKPYFRKKQNWAG